MSAFMVHEEHINVMIWAATERASSRYTGPVMTYLDPHGVEVRVSSTEPESLNRAGQMLVDANAASMGARYGEHDHGYSYRYQRPQRTDWRQVDLLKALTCFEYQACEVDDFNQTEAGRFCETMRHGLIRRLPGMDAAPWEIGPTTSPGSMAA